MKVVFCTRVYNMEDYEKYCAKAGHNLSLSDSNFTHRFIEGIEANLRSPIALVNVTPIPGFPQYPDIIIKTRTWKHTEKANDIECGYINLPIIKQYTRSRRIYHSLKKLISDEKDKIQIVTYDLHVDACVAIQKIKNAYPDIHTTVILPDIPELMMDVRKIKKGSLAEKYVKKQMSYINMFDSYVFVTRYMHDFISDINKPYTIIEGMWSGKTKKKVEKREINNTRNIVLYSGLLAEEYCIHELVQAIVKINEMYDYCELWICGDGQERDYVADMSQKFNYIKYFGYVNSNEMENLQQKATLLINPRPNEGKYTRYSFPSKTISYLAAGKPVIAYKLDGIPDEYDKHIIYIDSLRERTESIVDSIKSILELTEEEREVMGRDNMRFIESNKQSKIMCKRIIQMWSKICSK